MGYLNEIGVRQTLGNLPRPDFLSSLLPSWLRVWLTGNATALALRKALVRPFCLGAFYSFSQMADDVRDTQVQSEAARMSLAAHHYRPRAPKKQA